VTRVLVTGHPAQHQQHPTGHHDLEHGASAETSPKANDPSEVAGPGGRLQAAMALLPPILGGVPTQPLEVGGPAGSCCPPSGPPWPSVTAGVCSPAAAGPWPGAKLIIYATGSTAARPTSRISPWCAEPTTAPSMRAAGGWPANPTATSPPPHRIEDTGPPPDCREVHEPSPGGTACPRRHRRHGRGASKPPGHVPGGYMRPEPRQPGAWAPNPAERRTPATRRTRRNRAGD
jgi:hypothetical protein